MARDKMMARKSVSGARNVRIDPTATSSRAAPSTRATSSRSRPTAEEEVELMPPEIVGELTPESYGFKLKKRAHRERFDNLKGREIVAPRHIDWVLLAELGLLDTLVDIINPKSLNVLVNLAEPAYKSLVLEFLSTLDAHIFEGRGREEGECTFWLGGIKRVLNLVQINHIFGMRDHSRYAARGERQAYWLGDEQWMRISGEGEAPLPGRAKAASIRHPVIKILQRYFANTITARGDGEDKVPKKELLILSSILEDKDVDYGAVMMSNLAYISTKTSGAIKIGALVTRFAQHFGVDLSKAVGKVDSKPMDFTYFRNMKVLFEKNGHYYWVIGDTKFAMRLPNPQRTHIRVGLDYARTWLITPEPSDLPYAEVARGGKKRKVEKRTPTEAEVEMMEEMAEEEEEYEPEAAEEEEEDTEEEEEQAEDEETQADYGGGFQSGQMDQISQMFSNMTTHIDGRLDYMEQNLTHQLGYMRQSQAHAQNFYDEQLRQIHERMSGWTSEGFPEYTYTPYQGYAPFQDFPPYQGYPSQQGPYPPHQPPPPGAPEDQ